MHLAPYLLLVSGGAFFGSNWGSEGLLTWLLPVSTFLIGAMIPFARRSKAVVSHDAPESFRSAMPSYKQSYPEFCRELDRVRRYDRDLALLVLKLDEKQLVEIREGLLSQLAPGGSGGRPEDVITCAVQVMFANVGYLLEDVLRDLDVAACDVAHSRYVILVPELSARAAEGTAKRLRDVMRQVAGVRVRIGISEFRTDGVLIEDLVTEASDRADRSDSESGSAITLNPLRSNGASTQPVRG